ncbi:MAG: HAD family hydrolase [Spirochaetales bacterium]|nr:HAD family hydrolase [Spirochaetales bacterium]
MKRIKACFFDIDGTLVRSDHTISRPVIEAVQRLEEEGVAPVIATGRSYEALLPVKEALGIHSPLICYNGAMIVDGRDGKVLKHHTLPEKEARAVIQMARQLDYHILAYRSGELIYEKNRREVDEYFDRIKLEGKVVDFDKIEELNLTKCLMIADHEKLLPVKDEILARYPDKLNAFNSDPRFLEIVPEGIDKAGAVREVMDLLGGTVEESMAMGDGFNDLPMLEAVRWGVVMANALPALRGKFPPERTAPHCDEDGVALYLADFFKWEER